MIRDRNNRKVINKGRNQPVSTLAETIKTKVNFKFKEFNLYVSHLKIMIKSYKPKNLNTIIVHGFNKNNPMILYTNREIKNKDDLLEAIKLYLIRWLVEENFRLIYIKYDKLSLVSFHIGKNIKLVYIFY